MAPRGQVTWGEIINCEAKGDGSWALLIGWGHDEE